MDEKTLERARAVWAAICRYVDDQERYRYRDQLDKEDIAAGIFEEAAGIKVPGTFGWDPQKEPLGSSEIQYFDRCANGWRFRSSLSRRHHK